MTVGHARLLWSISINGRSNICKAPMMPVWMMKNKVGLKSGIVIWKNEWIPVEPSMAAAS